SVAWEFSVDAMLTFLFLKNGEVEIITDFSGTIRERATFFKPVTILRNVRSFVAESDNAYKGGPLADDYYSKSGSAQFIDHVRKALLCIQPIGIEGRATWVWGQVHMGRSGEGFGTVPVYCGAL
nr:hypothetical protein [Tanacetum cinerariifolium]